MTRATCHRSWSPVTRATRTGGVERRVHHLVRGTDQKRKAAFCREPGREQGVLQLRRRLRHVLEPGRPGPLAERRDQRGDLVSRRYDVVIRNRVVEPEGVVVFVEPDHERSGPVRLSRGRRPEIGVHPRTQHLESSPETTTTTN
jgi:hypothetical protein